MKRNMCIVLFIVFGLFVYGCDSVSPETYPQSILERPDSIRIETGNAVLNYRKGEEIYEELFEMMAQNWWMTAEGVPEVSENSDLMMPASVDELEDTSDRIYRDSDDAIISFCYDQASVQWMRSDGCVLNLKTIAFVLPDLTEKGSNVKGFFSISQTESFETSDGIFTYYYPAEIVNKLGNYLTHEQKETQPAVVEQFYPQEQAMLDGCLVMDEGDVRHNMKNWMIFLETCKSGAPAQISVIHYFGNETPVDYIRYDLSFDGAMYTVRYQQDGETVTDTSSQLSFTTGLCDETVDPYDSFERYSLNDLVLYEDLIAHPDYEGVTEIFLHVKEGDPPVKTYLDPAAVDGILQLLMTADYIPSEPENYIYGMKLLMSNRQGKNMVIELDLRQGVYRYGMQNYAYGDVTDLFAALGISQWPEEVLTEYSAYLNE